MAAALAAGLIGGAVAQESVPNTFADVPVPQLTGWNEVNRLTVVPGVDGYSGATARTHVYASQAAKAAAEAALANDALSPGDLEDALWAGSPATVYFELDDGSGRPPGIQVVTDDLDFPTQNCIMASGERLWTDGELAGQVLPKTCSDPEGSAKRYFLEITEAGTPVDLVFDTGMKDIRYKGVRNPEEDGGEDLATFREEYGIGRIYRVIQKVVNNSDERWLGLKVELGHGVGFGFQPLNFGDDGVAFELRTVVPREFFEGETGSPDREVWNPERYSTFSPKAFDDGTRPRFDPGFFDANPAGFFLPADFGGGADKTSSIFSGDDLRADGAYGAITPNHFSMVDNQASGSNLPLGLFGYMMSDSIAPDAISRYDSGDPDAESDAIEAWWDGTDWRYGQAGDALGLNPFGVVDGSQLTQWAAQLLGIDPSQGDSSVRYASLLADDLATQNMDIFIYIGEGILDEEGNPKYENITLRVTAVPSTYLGAVVGNDEPAWVDSPAPPLASYMAKDGVPVALNDSRSMDENPAGNLFCDHTDPTLNIDVLANDLLDGELLGDSVATIDSVNLSATAVGGVAELAAGNTVNFTPDVGFTDVASFTYTVTVDGKQSNEATVVITVNECPDQDAPVASSDSAVTFVNTPVTIDVLANDELPTGGAGTTVVDIENDPLTGSAVIDEDNRVVYTPGSVVMGEEKFYLDRFSYTVTVNGKESNMALITVRVDEIPEADQPGTDDPATDDPAPSSSSGGGTLFGCSYSPGAPFDPTLLMLALAALGGIAYRNRRREQKQ